VQVDDDSGGFFNLPIIYDSGKIPDPSTVVRSFVIPAGALEFNRRYQVRVKVWDVNDNESNWETMSLCNGPGCQAGNTSWRTPLHAYPSNINFTWDPSKPMINQLVQFDRDTTICYDNGGLPMACANYTWNFGDGTPVLNEPDGDPTHTYFPEGTFTVEFQATDSDGYTCPVIPLSKQIDIIKPFPGWREGQPI
jgi:hypothetical protein